MFVDYVLNQEGFGPVGSRMQQVRFDPGLMRPFVGSDGHTYVTVNTGRTVWDDKRKRHVPVLKNYRAKDMRDFGVETPTANATLLKDTWQQIDNIVVRATRKRLRAWSDLAASSTRGGFNAMAHTTLEYQSANDPGEAVVDMDALTEGRRDRPLYTLKSIPLPITHSDFSFSAREIAVSRNRGTSLDMTMVEAGARRVAEMIEKTTIGVETGLTYGPSSSSDSRYTGTSTIYGYTNFPYRVTKTDLTTPTGSNPDAVLTDVLEMIETQQTNGYYGPYMLYHSTAYSRYLSDDYFRTGGTSANTSLRQRLLDTEEIVGIRRLDYLTTGYQLILVQMDPEVAQAIDGMGVTTLQWETKGGLEVHFKIMAIMLPLLKMPYNGVTGIVHGTTS